VKTGLTRRQFLAVTILAGTMARRAVQAAGAGSKANAFAYEPERFSTVDPKLVRYEELRRWTCTQQPRRIRVDAEGRVYVAASNRVTVYTPAGEQVRELETQSAARCVSVATDGTVYVGTRDTIECFDANGKRQATWPSPGPKTWFSALAVNDNMLFAADSGNRVVHRFDRSGKHTGRIGAKDKDRNIPGLILPSPYLDVEIAPDGLLRVNNPGRHRVELYTVDGDLEGFWGSAGGGIAGFCGCCNPIGLAVMGDGKVVTSEKGFPRVKVYDHEGNMLSVVAAPESFPENNKAGAGRDLSDGTMAGLDVAVDAAGQVYILDLITAKVHVMKPKAAA
jgi:sugar lactone lactonase YvrE